MTRFLVKSHGKESHIMQVLGTSSIRVRSMLTECNHTMGGWEVIEECHAFTNEDYPTCEQCQAILAREKNMPFNPPSPSEDLETAARAINNVRNFMNQSTRFSFKDYQDKTKDTAVYPDAGSRNSTARTYVALGLASEAGEVVDVFKKVIRDSGGVWNTEMRMRLKAELGDVLWYVARLCTEFGWDMGIIAENNLTKLSDRKEKGELHGR